MDLFTPSPKPKKRPAQASETGRRTKANTPQSTRSESLASNLRPGASREPKDSTRRKPQNAKAGPSKLGKQAEIVSTPPTRQSRRVSRLSAKKSAATKIVLSSDEDSDLPSPSTILEKVPKTPPARPKKRKRASSPVKTQAKKISKAIYIEISDSDDEEHAKTRPVTKRPKVTKNTAPEDIIDLCSSSENEGPPPSSPLAQVQHRKSSPGMNARHSETADTEVRKPKKPSREREVPTPEVADSWPQVDPPRQAIQSLASPSSQPSPRRPPSPSPQPSPQPQCPPSPQRPPSPSLVRSSPPQPTSLSTRIKSMRMVRVRSILSGRKFTRPERESEITYFEPDSQPQLTLLTHRFFKKSIASLKAKIEVQKRKKRKAAMSALVSASTSAPARHLEGCMPSKTSQKVPNSIANAFLTLTKPPEPPLQPDNPADVSVEQTELGTVPCHEAMRPSSVANNDGKSESTSSEIAEPIPSVKTIRNEACEPNELTIREIPDIQDLIASAKHVTNVLDKLKSQKSRNSSEFFPSKNAQAEFLQPLQVDAQSSLPSVDRPDRTMVSPSPIIPKPAQLAPSRHRIPLPTRTSSVPAMKVRQNPVKLVRDAPIETPQQLRPQSAPLTSSKSPLLLGIVPIQAQDNSIYSQRPSTSPDTSDTSDALTMTTATSTSDKPSDMEALQRQSPPCPAPPKADADRDADAVMSSSTEPDMFSALGLDMAALSCLPDIEGDSAAYDDMSLSDLELVYPEDLA